MISLAILPEEKIYTSGDAYFNDLILALESAKSTIDFETYIFSQDSIGSKIKDVLINAAKRGVKVRLLIDGAGTLFWGGKWAREFDAVGVKTKIYHPLPWSLGQWHRAKIKLPMLFKVFYLSYHINSRNHRKVVLVDKRILFTGSMNVSDCHLSKVEGGQNWRDMGIQISKFNLQEVITAFEHSWQKSEIHDKLERLRARSTARFRLNNSWFKRRFYYRNLLRRVARSKERIWIANAFFIPDRFLLKKLADSASRGVDVKIILSGRAEPYFTLLVSRLLYRCLLKKNVEIYEYQPSVLHAKYLIIDESVLLGSSNLNHRSLLHDLELDVELSKESSKNEIIEAFQDDLQQSKQITLETIPKYNLQESIVARISFLFKYFI
jgi:cardiolipin synthase A/B